MSTDQSGRPQPAWAFGSGRTTAIQRSVRQRPNPSPVASVQAVWRPLEGRVYSWAFADTWFQAGNAEFFDPDDPARIRLRPLLPSDMKIRRVNANSVLWVEHAEVGSVTAFYVYLFPRYTKECPDGVERALEYVRTNFGSKYLQPPQPYPGLFD